METIVVIVSMIVMFLWLRTEANADRREFNRKHDDISEKMSTLVESIREDVRAMQTEMKDFHDRLCKIEERRKNGR